MGAGECEENEEDDNVGRGMWVALLCVILCCLV